MPQCIEPEFNLNLSLINKNIILFGKYKLDLTETILAIGVHDLNIGKIKSVKHKWFMDLNQEDASNQGYELLSDLKRDLKLKFENISDYNYITIANW